jgi:hypothetical protein
MRRTSAFRALWVAALFGGSALGCGSTGWIRFQELDPSAEEIHQTPTRVYAIDCQDYEAGGPRAASALYVATCTKDGGAIPWKVMGAYRAARASTSRWDRYREEVVAKAERRGCPAVLVRRAAPAASSEAEAVGALCVDTEQPSGVSGPLRLVAVGAEPIQILADGQSLPSVPN